MKHILTSTLFVVALACSSPEHSEGVLLDAPQGSTLARAVEDVLAHPGLLADIDRAIDDLGFEPAPADVARTLSDLVTGVEPDTARQHELAAAVVTLVEAGVVPDLRAAIEALGPEPDPRETARALSGVIAD